MVKKGANKTFSSQCEKVREKRGRREEESVGDVNFGDKEQRLIKRSTKE